MLTQTKYSKYSTSATRHSVAHKCVVVYAIGEELEAAILVLNRERKKDLATDVVKARNMQSTVAQLTQYP